MPRSGFAWKLLEPGVSVKVNAADMVVPAEKPVPPSDLLLNRSAQPLQPPSPLASIPPQKRPPESSTAEGEMW